MNGPSYAEWRRDAVGIGIISRGNHLNSRGPTNERLCPGNGIPWAPTGGKEQVLGRVGGGHPGGCAPQRGQVHPEGQRGDRRRGRKETVGEGGCWSQGHVALRDARVFSALSMSGGHAVGVPASSGSRFPLRRPAAHGALSEGLPLWGGGGEGPSTGSL